MSADANRLYMDAVGLVITSGRCSTSYIQRHLMIGYEQARKIVLRMEANGIVARPDHLGKRVVLLAPDVMREV